MDSEPRFPELRKRFLSLAKKIIAIVKEVTDSSDKAKIILDFRLIVERDIVNYKEFTRFKDELQKIVGGEDYRGLELILSLLRNETLAQVALDAVAESLEDQSIVSLSLSDDLVGFGRIESAILEHPEYTRICAFAHQFVCEHPPVELDGGYRIREANVFEKAWARQELRSVTLSSESSYLVEIGPLPSIGETTLPEQGERKATAIMTTFPDGTVLYSPLKRKEDIEMLMSILRIIEPSSVGIQAVHYFFLHERTSLVLGLAAETEVFPADGGRMKKEMSLTDERAILLQNLWERFGRTERNDRLMRAMRRYNTALCSDDPEDALVDLIISLETLFQTMGFKVAFLCSFLLGLERTDRDAVLRVLERAYQVRNGIVHGGSIGQKDISVVDELFSIVARILQFSILMKLSGSKLNDRIRRAYANPVELRSLEREVKDWIARTEETR